MTNEIKISISPVAKPRMTQSDKWKGRECVLKYWAYKDNLTSLCNLNKFKLGNEFEVNFFIKMPESWSKRKKEKMNGKPHQSKPDKNNLTKALEDCLLGDDSGVWHTIETKRWAEEGSIHIRNIKNEMDI
ncbi:Rus Holliday junction resolvase [uncultured Caudovirales phage]|uniref:Rus Holliday junction resolvase n=1 Tax=uncultured Caudovirales phage TaxID=2100421 RepID=A0A6J5NUY7_9CAUD|nr:Rus Holliday junction resolvase [uncultured Caudovirales phage]CAB5224835.1 Rus Holliday junction resolvase [uncultured Caudovirales phage]